MIIGPNFPSSEDGLHCIFNKATSQKGLETRIMVSTADLMQFGPCPPQVLSSDNTEITVVHR